MIGKVKKVIEVDYRELEELIEKDYDLARWEDDRKRFSVAADLESANDTSHVFNVRKEKLDKWEQEKLAYFKEKGWGEFILQTLLIDMCNRGVIQPGEYLIKVFW